MKHCTVVYATPSRQWTWNVELPDDGTVADALHAAAEQAGALPVPWDADVGIFGEFCDRAARPRDNDRIEIYRQLSQDPKVSRRARAAAAKAARDPAAARSRTSSRPKSTR